MTQAVSVRAIRPAESRLIAGICAAHLMSHYYMLMLAPLLSFIRDDFNVTYTQLALALTVFNVVSAAFQTPVGFLVDRIGARMVLIVGLGLSSVAYARRRPGRLVLGFRCDVRRRRSRQHGLSPGGLFAAVAAHAAEPLEPNLFVSHLLRHARRRGCAGQPALHARAVRLARRLSRRGDFGPGRAPAVLLAQPEPALEITHAGKNTAPTHADSGKSGWRLLLTPAILINLAFFMLISIMGSGLNTYLVVALGALHGTPNTVANAALTALLAMNAAGVLAGGFLASRTSRHAMVAATGLTVGGIVTALLGLFDFPAAVLIALTGVSGLFVGATFPSRDMLVRAVTPPGAYGRVFGFVSTGFNIGASIAPLVYGMLMDSGQPRAVFFLSAAVSLLCVSTVTFGLSGRATR